MGLVTGLALGRVTLGAIAVCRPELAARALQLHPADDSRLSFPTRLFGSREVAVGVLTLLARGASRRNLAMAAVLLDAGDAAITYLALREGVVSRKGATPLIGAALAGAASGAAGLRRS